MYDNTASQIDTLFAASGLDSLLGPLCCTLGNPGRIHLPADGPITRRFKTGVVSYLELNNLVCSALVSAGDVLVTHGPTETARKILDRSVDMVNNYRAPPRSMMGDESLDASIRAYVKKYSHDTRIKRELELKNTTTNFPLLLLPPEIIANIMSKLSPEDLWVAGRTCRRLYAIGKVIITSKFSTNVRQEMREYSLSRGKYFFNMNDVYDKDYVNYINSLFHDNLPEINALLARHGEPLIEQSELYDAFALYNRVSVAYNKKDEGKISLLLKILSSLRSDDPEKAHSFIKAGLGVLCIPIYIYPIVRELEWGEFIPSTTALSLYHLLFYSFVVSMVLISAGSMALKLPNLLERYDNHMRRENFATLLQNINKQLLLSNA